MSEWKKFDETDTSTYPPSGIRVLAAVNTANYLGFVPNVVIVAKWVGEKELECHNDHCDDVVYDEDTDAYYYPEGWYETNVYNKVDQGVSDTVTHWMLIPDLPKVEI